MANKRIIISANTVWNILNFREGLIKTLVAKGYEVIVVAPHDEWVKKLEANGCRHVNINIDNKGTNFINDLKLLSAYRKIMKQEKADIFLGYTIKPNVYGSIIAHSLRIPVINNISGLGTAFIKKNWLTKVVKLLYKISLKKSDTVFFQNKDDRQLFIENKLVDEKLTKLLPGSGINTSKFKGTSLHSRSPNEKTEFLLIARLLYDKGVQEYIDAARILKAKNYSFKCSLLGFLGVENITSIPKKILQTYIDDGTVHYYGSSDDIRPFIENADCIVLPSYREGLPRSLLEGAAMSRPLIATDVPGCREIVDHGVNGFLCEVKNAEDLASKMKEFLDLEQSERALMGEASHEMAINEFEEKIVIDRYLDAIDQAFKLQITP